MNDSHFESDPDAVLDLPLSDDGPTEASLELPEWYIKYGGNVSIWTPYATVVIHNKLSGTTMPFVKGWPATHYYDPHLDDDLDRHSYRHQELAPDLLAIKPFGEPRQYYRVEAVEIDDE